mmetsp:Transcript_47150/g.86543  ORF Transcript_47150/g.86543 Transcript_47150/m.86543 type:complete len:202 (-) Transcript_47150:147-752(-)
MDTRPRVFSEYVDRGPNSALQAEMGASSWPFDQFLDPRRCASAPARKPSEAPWEVPPLKLPSSPFVRSKRSYSGSGTTAPDELNITCEDEDLLDEAEDDDDESFDFCMEGLEDGNGADNGPDPPFEFEHNELASDYAMPEVKNSVHTGNGLFGSALQMNGLGNTETARSGSMSPGASPTLLSVLGEIAAEAKCSPRQSINP